MIEFKLKKRRVGRTDLYVTPIGLGGGYLGLTTNILNEKLAVETVIHSLELGVNLIDTSPFYLNGKSEKFVGLGLKQWCKNGGNREQIFISTKVGRYPNHRDYSAKSVRKSVYKSMELLKIDYLDFVHVHDPFSLDPVLSPDGALEALKDLKQDGAIRGIGLGARKHEYHIRCIETSDFDVILTYRDFNLISQTAENVLEKAFTNDVGILNGQVILNGLLTGFDPYKVAKDNPKFSNRKEEVNRAKEFWSWTKKEGIKLLDLNLQWCLRDKRISSLLLGASTPNLIEQDVIAISTTINENVWHKLHNQFGI